MDTKQFESLWATRPVRPNGNRTVAGVCAGFAARYRVDPTLVKIAFVVATLFGGSGLVLYIAAWIALPSEDNADRVGPGFSGSRTRRHDGRAHMPHRNGKIVLLIVLAIILLTSFGPNRTWSSGGLLGAALMLLGWWLLYQRTPEAPAGTGVDSRRPSQVGVATGTGDALQPWIPRAMMNTPAPTTSPSWPHAEPPTPQPATDDGPPVPGITPDVTAPPTTYDSGEHGPSGYGASGYGPSGYGASGYGPTPYGPSAYDTGAADELRTTPPAWDPLGAARFAWDLPEPAADNSPATPRERRSPLTLIVIGAAVIAAATGAALHQAGVDWFTPVRIMSMSLAVVGVGLIHAGLRRRRAGDHSSGLVPIALLLGAAIVLTSVIGHLSALPSGGVGERTYTPLSEADIKSDYSLTMGKMVLDLRDVDITSDRTVNLRNGVGEIQVLVDENTNVRANCEAKVGDYDCPDGVSGGRDGTDGPILTIDAQTNVGHVEVAR